MIQLTESLIAVEVPKDLPVEKFEVVQTKGETRLYGYGELDRIGIWHLFDWIENCSLIGVTPLSEEQWKEVVGSHTSFENVYCNMTPYQIPVSPKDRWNDLQRHKGLDINKKYAIVES